MGFIWLLMLHTVLKTMLIRMYFTKFNPSRFVLFFMIFSVLCYFVFIGFHTVIMFTKEYKTCYDSLNAKFITTFTVKKNELHMSLILRGLLLGVPAFMKLFSAIYLVHFVQSIIDNEGEIVVSRKSIYLIHVIPAIIAILFILIQLSTEYLKLRPSDSKFYSKRTDVIEFIQSTLQSIFTLGILICFCFDARFGKLILLLLNLLINHE